MDVSALTAQPTGVATFLRFQLAAMMALAPEHRWLGFSSGRGGSGLAEVGLAGHRHVPLPTRALYQLWNWTGQPQVDRLLGGVDLYHATNYFLPPVAKARRVVTFYDLTFLKYPEWTSPRIVGPFQRNIGRFAREADGILTCSEASKGDIMELLGVPEEKVAVAYGAVDSLFQPMDKEAARELVAQCYGVAGPYFLFVSTLEPRKNVYGLLEGFKKAAAHLPHALILVGGLGWKMEGFDEELARLGLGDRVRRMGYIPDRGDLPAFYSGAEALVMPSFYEGFGFPVLEAMACGCPVITAPVSSLPEVAGEGALYVAPEDLEGLGAAMERIAGDRALSAALTEKGLAQAARFTWEDCGRRTLDLYGRLW